MRPGNAVISLVQLTGGIGTCSAEQVEVLRLNHNGFVAFTVHCDVRGTGAVNGSLCHEGGWIWAEIAALIANIIRSGNSLTLCASYLTMRLAASVTTDAVFIMNSMSFLRSEE